MAYDKLDNDDIGFKLLDGEDLNVDLNERLEQLPYLFKRSEIANEIKKTKTHSQTLYLRNKTRMRDYEISFFRPDDMNAF